MPERFASKLRGIGPTWPTWPSWPTWLTWLTWLIWPIWIALAVAVVSASAQTIQTSSPAARKALSMTIYDSGFALVRDTRTVDLPRGTVRLQFVGVPTEVEAATVQIRSTTAPERLLVLEQNYEDGLLDPDALLKKYVGQEVTIVQGRLQNNSQVEERIKAVLLSDRGGPVWQIGNKIVTGLGSVHYVFSEPLQQIYTQPTLVWLLDNRQPGSQTVEVAYLTNGIGWHADYTLAVGAGEKAAQLAGWATIRNESGAAFPDTTLQLVAGSVHRVYPAGPRPIYARAQVQAASSFAQQTLSAYHLYTLGRRTALPNGESKQISLFSSPTVSILQNYEVNGQPYYFRTPEPPGAPWKDPVQVHIRFRNSKTNALGLPLPAGTVRVYQNDSAGRIQFLGEDTIGHTPQGETVNLHMGNAFDVVEERKQTSYRQLGPHTSETAYEIVLRNHRSQTIGVQVNEPFSGDWKILNSNFAYRRTSAFSASFSVPVPAHGQSSLNYRVEVRWGGVIGSDE